MFEKFSYALGRWVYSSPGQAIALAAFIGVVIYASANQPKDPTFEATKKQVAAATPTPVPPDPRIEACGPGMESRLANAKGAFAKKDFEGAFLLLDYCDGRMPKDSAEYKEYMLYAIAQGKASDVRRAKELKAEKIEKKKHGVQIGMTQQDVIDSSWGRPNSTNTTTTRGGVRAQWVYGSGNYLYFEDGILTSIQN